jgi:hypothetical protein
MSSVVIIPCGDGSQIIAHYTPGTRWVPPEAASWELTELYHELPMEGNPPTASALTNLRHMIDAVACYKPPFENLYEQIAEAIDKAQNP